MWLCLVATASGNCLMLKHRRNASGAPGKLSSLGDICLWTIMTGETSQVSHSSVSRIGYG